MIHRKSCSIVHLRATANSFYSRKQSILVPLPLPLPPIFDQIQTLLKPTFKTTTILRESFESGAQKELAVRAWKKAWSGEPFILARNACSRMWKLWKGDDPKDP
jgi:hypothetical protein